MQTYNNFSTINLKKKNVYKTYYILAKEICETSYTKQNITNIKDLTEMFELIYEDIFYNSYEIDGEGNIDEIVTNLNMDMVLPYLNNPEYKMENIKNDKNPQSSLIKMRGGKHELQTEHNISQKYNSIDHLIKEKERQQEILVSVLSSKLAYLDLKPRYSIIRDGLSKTGLGYLSYKNSTGDTNTIYNKVDIYNTIPYYEKIEERIAPEAGKFFKIKEKQEFGSTRRILDKESMQHIVVIFKWNDDPTDLTTYTRSTIISDFIKNDFRMKIGRKNITEPLASVSVSESTERTEATDTEASLVNLGRINYYLLYDMKSDKFYLTLRGTNFGNRSDDVGNYLSSGISNIMLDLQIAIDKVIEMYDRSTGDRRDLINKLRDYLMYIVYNLLIDLKTLITNKIFKDYGNFDTLVDIIIHVLFSEPFNKHFHTFIDFLIAIPRETEFRLDALTGMIREITNQFIDKIYFFPYIQKLVPILTKDKIEEYINSISKMLHLCITKKYLHFTKDHSKKVVDQAKHIVTRFGHNADNLIICGHSLGGGLTQYLCNLNNLRGYTFNSIGGKILREDVILNFESEFKVSIPEIVIKPDTFSWAGVALKVAKLFNPTVVSSITTAFSIIFTRLIFNKIELPNDISNIVISQDVIHKVLLSCDNEQHIGELYMCSIRKYLDFYTKTHLFSTEPIQFSNITMFHGIDGLLILLNKIINDNGEKIKYLNSPIITYNSCSEISDIEYCDYRENYIYYSNDIVSFTKRTEVAEVEGVAAAGRGSYRTGSESSKKYYKKYLKYKNKYLMLCALKK
jgi:hypothetical protein